MSSVPMFHIAARAREQGIKVLLSGEGADELLGGYDWLAGPADRDFAARGRPLERAARAVYRRLNALGIRRGPRPPEVATSEAVMGFERDLGRSALRAYAHHSGPRRRLEAQLLAQLGTYLPHLLNRQDKTTMMASVETREPFLDPDLVGLAVNLPLEMRVEPRRKAVLADVGRRHLPEAIAERPKIGFGFDVRDYLLPVARLDFLLEGRVRELLGVAREPWRAQVLGASEWHSLVLWSSEIWARAFLEGHGPESIVADLWRQDPAAQAVSVPEGAGEARPARPGAGPAPRR